MTDFRTRDPEVPDFLEGYPSPSSQLFPPKPPKIPHFFTESANNPFIINSDYF